MRPKRRPRTASGLAVTAAVLPPGRLPVPGRYQPARPRLGWRSDPEAEAASFERSTVPAPSGERTAEPLLVVLIFDVSPSQEEADPLGYRFVAGRRLIDLFDTELHHPGDRLAVVLFSTLAQPVLRPTTPHTKTGRRALRHIMRPAAGAGTDISAGLRAGARAVPGGWPGPVVTMIFTDGEDDSTPSTLQRAVAQFPPGSVHLVSMGTHPPEHWQSVPLGSITVIESMDRPDDAEWCTARAAYRALGLDWTGPLTPPSRQL